jgi:FkbM family methyltransferase
MLISLDYLVKKYKIVFKGILHVGAHKAEEIYAYEKYIGRNKILWVEAMKDKVEYCISKFPNILVENATVSDKEEIVKFNESNNDGLSSSFLELGIHKIKHPEVHYIKSYEVKTSLLENILSKYENIEFNFLNFDIQGAELKALKGMGKYLNNVDYVYLEVNSDYVYEKCNLVEEIDEYLLKFNLKRVETTWFGDCKWGDAFYIRIHN